MLLQVININHDILIVVTIMTHPNVGCCLGWCESHLTKTIREAVVPVESRAKQSIQGLGNNEDVSLHFSEFRPTNDRQFLGWYALR
jgi:hypothetical protein